MHLIKSFLDRKDELGYKEPIHTGKVLRLEALFHVRVTVYHRIPALKMTREVFLQDPVK